MSTRGRPTTETSRDEGASAIEYALVIAALAAIVVLLTFSIGTFVRNGL